MHNESPLVLFESLQGPALFKELPKLLDPWQWLVVATAFLLITYGHVVRTDNAPATANGTMGVWLRTLLCIAFMVTVPMWGGRLLESSISAYDQSRGDGCYGVARRCVRLASLMPDLEGVLGASGPSKEDPDGFADLRGYSEELWEEMIRDDQADGTAGKDLVNLDESAVPALQTAITLKAGTVFASYVISATSLYGVAFVNILSEAARYLALALILFLAPLAVAGLGVPSFQLASVKALRLGVFTALLPLLWMVCALGTAGFFNFHASMLAPMEAESVGAVTWKSIEDADTISSARKVIYARQGMNVSYAEAGLVAGSAVLLLLWGGLSLLAPAWLAWKCFGLVDRSGGFANPGSHRGQVAVVRVSESVSVMNRERSLQVDGTPGVPLRSRRRVVNSEGIHYSNTESESDSSQNHFE